MLKTNTSLFPQLRVGKLGAGPDGYSSLGIVSSMVVNQRPLGQRLVAGDDSTGYLSFPHPDYTGDKVTHMNFMFTPGWQNAAMARKRDLTHFDTSEMAFIRFQQQHETRTPIPQTNRLPLEWLPQ